MTQLAGATAAISAQLGAVGALDAGSVGTTGASDSPPTVPPPLAPEPPGGYLPPSPSAPLPPSAPPVTAQEEAEAAQAAAQAAVEQTTSALNGVASMLDGLNAQGVALQPADVGPILALLDLSVAAAAAATMPVAAVGAPSAPPSSTDATTVANTPPTEEEAARSNAAADAMTAVLNQVGAGLTAALAPGDPPVTVDSTSFTMVVQKALIPTAENATAATAVALQALTLASADSGAANASAPQPAPQPMALFAPVDDALTAKLVSFAAASSAPVFVVPPSLAALQGQESVDVQLVSYKASSRSPPPPPAAEVGQPGEVRQVTSSAITSLTLRADGGQALQVNASGGEPILLTTSIPPSARRRLQQVGYDCRTEQDPLDECFEALRNASAELLAQQALCNAAKESQGASLTASFSECDTLSLLAEAAQNKSVECAALPLACSSRGVCDGQTGACSCNSRYMGQSCNAEPHCRYWDVNTSSWSSQGVELVSLDLTTGGVVCGATHLTDFAMVSDVLANPDAFFESAVNLNVNLPRPMSLDELLSVLGDIDPGEYTGIAAATIIALGAMYYAIKYDDKRAFVEFFPRWHEHISTA